MTTEEIKDIISAQKHCFMRKCNRRCANCDLARDPNDIMAAYDAVLQLIKSQKDIKTEFFNSGVEYAKNEFVRLLDKEKDNVGDLHKNKAVNDLIFTQVLGLQKARELAETISGR